jgi:hypothetical protein
MPPIFQLRTSLPPELQQGRPPPLPPCPSSSTKFSFASSMQFFQSCHLFGQRLFKSCAGEPAPGTQASGARTSPAKYKVSLAPLHRTQYSKYMPRSSTMTATSHRPVLQFTRGLRGTATEDHHSIYEMPTRWEHWASKSIEGPRGLD